MSIIKFSVTTLGGALNPVQSTAEISVGRNEKARVVMEGYIGAGRMKDSNGDYKPSAFGRLPCQAALVGDDDKRRLVIEIAGGLRGVLFKNAKKKAESDPDYNGKLEVGDEEYGLFGRKVKTDAGEFISLSSTEASPRQQTSKGANSVPAHDHADDSRDVPF